MKVVRWYSPNFQGNDQVQRMKSSKSEGRMNEQNTPQSTTVPPAFAYSTTLVRSDRCLRAAKSAVVMRIAEGARSVIFELASADLVVSVTEARALRAESK